MSWVILYLLTVAYAALGSRLGGFLKVDRDEDIAAIKLGLFVPPLNVASGTVGLVKYFIEPKEHPNED